MRTEIGVGLIGFGTVGTGVARVLIENAELIRRRVLLAFELAERETDPGRRRQFLTFAVIGESVISEIGPKNSV